MQAPTTRSGRLPYQEHDRIAILEDVPALGIRKGDEGIVRNFELYNDTVFDFVMITYSTNQTREWVIMEITPPTFWRAPFIKQVARIRFRYNARSMALLCVLPMNRAKIKSRGADSNR